MQRSGHAFDRMLIFFGCRDRFGKGVSKVLHWCTVFHVEDKGIGYGSNP